MLNFGGNIKIEHLTRKIPIAIVIDNVKRVSPSPCEVSIRNRSKIIQIILIKKQNKIKMKRTTTSKIKRNYICKLQVDTWCNTYQFDHQSPHRQVYLCICMSTIVVFCLSSTKFLYRKLKEKIVFFLHLIQETNILFTPLFT